MFAAFGNFVTKRRWYILVFWILAAVAVVSFSPKLSDVTSNDQASFLPSSYESVRAQEIAKESFPETEGQAALIVFKNSSGTTLSDADQQNIFKTVLGLNAAKIPKVKTVFTAPQMLSENQKLQLAQAQLTGLPQDEALLDSVAKLRDELAKQIKGTGLKVAVTGNAAIALDTRDSSGNAEKIVGIVTLLLILILPTIIFRSPFAAFLPLVSVGIIYTMATSLLALCATIFDFQVSGQLTSLLIVILFGIGTDYILFLLFRYRERLRSGDHTRGAVSFALSRAGEPIVSAALVVGVAFAALFVASLGFFSSLAPGLVISVVLMLLASTTLVPALLAIVGEKIFWPSKKWQTEQTGSLAGKLGGLVSRRPGRTAIVILVVLLALASGIFHYRASFDLASQLPPNAESTTAFKELSNAYPAGTTSPTRIYVRSEQRLNRASLAKLQIAVKSATGVAAVTPAQVSANGRAALISAVLADEPSSATAIANIAGPIRTAAHGTGLNAEIVVGGETAIYADLQHATNRDMRTIVLLAGALIFVILAILLRSLIAPIYLLLAVGLGVVATLGATTYLFVVFGGSLGLVFMLPILLYVFVVAVGTDYNILMITRLREEMQVEQRDPKLAAQKAIEHTTSTLISAGVILAGTFASLLFAGLGLLTQMGFSVSLGIALGAFLISLLLIPALSTLLGKRIWWPSRSGKNQPPSDTI